MKASETQLKAILDGQKQYRVPFFQRRYSWERRQWEDLWQDIVDLYQSDAEEDHFIGSIVTSSLSGPPEGVWPFLLIDGQQRLTTLCVLLAAIRDEGRERTPAVAERINGLYLTNRFVHGLDQLKVLPSYHDRPAFKSVIEEDNPQGSRIADAYRFFLNVIKTTVLEGEPLQLERLEATIVSRLSLVSITLSPEENAYRIFESLNAKGMPLTQADLLRNYFFMRLPQEKHEEYYLKYWEPMQSALGKQFDDYIRDYLVKDGEFVRTADVYQAWKKRLDKSEDELLRIHLVHLWGGSRSYFALVNPEQTQLASPIKDRLLWLKRWGATTIYPFLLNLFPHLGGSLPEQDFVRILRLIQSFLVRRLFARVPPNELNRLLIRLYTQLPRKENFLEETWEIMSEPGRRWPTDAEFTDGILNLPLYRDGRPEQRRLILESLEESYDHREPVDVKSPKIQIEHVMPQTLTSEWITELGEHAKVTHEKLIHTLGNLTLSGYNQPLSNIPFQRKSQILAGSHLELNREIQAEERWTAEQIETRARRLADRAIEIWPGPKR